MRSPNESIIGGYDIHVVFTKNQQKDAEHLFVACLYFLDEHEIAYHNQRLFSDPIGPWPTGMWQLELPSSAEVYHDLGMCISWLMINRGVFSVMIHPNTKKEGERGGPIEDHGQNHLWLGRPIELNMSIFY